MLSKIKNNKLLIGVIGIYVLILLSTLNWGLPSTNRVFLYHMDEWHQLMAVRAVRLYGTPNVAGAAHGPVFQFFLSGLYLIPLVKLRFLKLELVDSAVSGLEMQRRFFQVLRVNTLLFGVLAIVVIYIILKKQFKIKPNWGILLFVFTPVWLILSGHFKYDIALIFWLLLAIWLILRYGREQSLKNYVLAGMATALAVATKISGIPLVLMLVLAYFLYSKNWKQDYRILFSGITICFLVFVFVGIPDVLLGRVDRREYYEFFYSNLVTNPELTSNYLLGMPWWVYLLVIQLPGQFGYGLWFMFMASLGYWVYDLVKMRKVKRQRKYKDELLMLLGLVVFTTSLVPLKLSAAGNRSLVLLPFMTTMTALSLAKVVANRKKQKHIWLTKLMIVILGFQIVESVSAVSLKWQKDPRAVASGWIGKNIPQGTLIGLENVPIYQMIPDVLLKDYYFQQHGLIKRGKYNYQLISSKSEKLPEVVIVTNQSITEYQKESEKKSLVKRLAKEEYEEKARFNSKLTFEQQLIDKFNLLKAELIPAPFEISIFFRKKQQKLT